MLPPRSSTCFALSMNELALEQSGRLSFGGAHDFATPASRGRSFYHARVPPAHFHGEEAQVYRVSVMTAGRTTIIVKANSCLLERSSPHSTKQPISCRATMASS